MLVPSLRRDWKWQSLFCAQPSLLLPHRRCPIAWQLGFPWISPVQLLHRLRGLHPADSAAPRHWSQLKKTGMSSNIPCHFLLSVRGGELGGSQGKDLFGFNLRVSSLVLSILLFNYLFCRGLKMQSFGAALEVL